MAFRNRLCLVTDIAGYSGHTVPERADAEHRLMRVQNFALAHARAYRVQSLPRENRGDGQLLLLPPLLDPTTAIPALVAGLRHALHLANSDLGLFGRLRIRVSLAVGAIQQRAPLGPQGNALITACRLNDAEQLKQALTQRTDADLAFIVPDDLYRDVIRHDFGSLRSAEFTKLKIAAKGYTGPAWMYLPTSGPMQEAATSTWRATAVEFARRRSRVSRGYPAKPRSLSHGSNLQSDAAAEHRGKHLVPGPLTTTELTYPIAIRFLF
jgi:hypothetical protein